MYVALIKERLNVFVSFCCGLLLLTSLTLSAEPLSITLIDHQTQQPVSLQKLVAKQIMADGSLAWRQRQSTDAGGVAAFDLAFDDNQRYLFEAKVFNGFTARLGPVTRGGQHTLTVAKQKIVLRDGTQSTTPAFALQKVKLQRLNSSGEVEQTLHLTTDEQGALKLDLDNHLYQLRAASLVSQKWKTLEPFNGLQDQQFTVGEVPLTLTLRNAETGAPIAQQQVTAWRLEADGRKWASRQSTDASGQIIWELEGLNSGTQYQLSSKYFDGFDSRSAPISQSGGMTWSLGDIRVQLQDGSSTEKPPLAGYEVHLQTQQEGSFKTLARLTSDANGWVRFDLPSLNTTTAYRLRARSAIDGKHWYSYPVTGKGSSQFVVGDIPLTVSLVSAASNEPIANTEITVHTKNPDGSRKWLARKTTDTQGKAIFDLPELRAGQQVQLATKVFHNRRSYSKPIAESGPFTFAIGTTRLLLKNGTLADQPVLANHQVDIVQETDGKRQHIARLTSDPKGVIQVDLDSPDVGNPYLVRSKSPIDSKATYEWPITSTGQHQLVVGSTPLTVRFQHARTGAPLVDQRVDVQRLDSEGKYRYFRQRKTDDNGVATFDIAELDGNQLFRVRGKVFNNLAVHSDPINRPEDLTMTFGNLQVTVRDGSQASQPALAEYPVSIKLKHQDSGKTRWYGKAVSDSAGRLQLDLPTPPENESYVLSAKSLTDGKHKDSDVIARTGDMDFVVGNQPLRVTVQDMALNAPAADLRVVAEQRTADASWSWAAAATTDAAGQLVFDLDGLGQGSTYRLRAKKYRGTVYSDELSATGDYRLNIGQLPVTLSHRETAQLMSGIKLTAFRFLPDGQLQYEASGTTDSEGQLVFDLHALGDTRYILKAHRPFPDVRHIYSPVILAAGAMAFSIDPDDSSELDTQAPTLTFSAPETDQVSQSGFVVAGHASDNDRLDRLELVVDDAVSPAQQLTVTTFSGRTWQASIAGDGLTLDTQVTITATLYDRMGNRATAQRSFMVIDDDEAPQLRVLSHAQQDDVNVTGFTVSGDVTDNLQVTSMTAHLTDSALGDVFADRAVSVDPLTGQWAVYVGYGQVAENSQLQFRFSASDAAGNVAEQHLQLSARKVNLSARHLLQRATFGVRPGLEDAVLQSGVDAWLEQQLNPASIDDSLVMDRVASLPLETLDDLRIRELTYQIYSQRQLQQVMAWFWENHFSTQFRSHDVVSYEARENTAFRQHALGRFRDLLEASAKSPAMLLYLNNHESVKANPNENYARELLELHTLGVDGGYTGEDIEALARILTGWQVSDTGNFTFNADDHDDQDKFFLGETYPAGGVDEGERVLDTLSRHPATAQFICKKLLLFWVSDDPLPRLQQDCANAFVQSDGDIAQVLRIIFNAEEFNGGEHFAAKIKTPLELYTSAVRSLGAAPDLAFAADLVADMGMPLFAYPAPDGFSDAGDDWINVNAMLQRSRFAAELALRDRSAQLNLKGMLEAQGVRTAEAIVGYLFNLLLSTTTQENERVQALAILNDDGEFSLDDDDADEKLRMLVATLLSYPGFQYQ